MLAGVGHANASDLSTGCIPRRCGKHGDLDVVYSALCYGLLRWRGVHLATVSIQLLIGCVFISLAKVYCYSFIPCSLTGNGLVLLKGGGATIVKELAAGEELRTTPGSIIAMQNSIGFDVQLVSGLKNVLFGATCPRSHCWCDSHVDCQVRACSYRSSLGLAPSGCRDCHSTA